MEYIVKSRTKCDLETNQLQNTQSYNFIGFTNSCVKISSVISATIRDCSNGIIHDHK